MATWLVTGGAGFIGSALIRMLLSETNHRVVNVDKLTYAGNLESLVGASDNPSYVFENIDICDVSEIRRCFEHHRPDVVVHLAAESHVDRSIDGPAVFVQTNVVGTFVLLQESLRHYRALRDSAQERFRFVHVSTDEVFGSLGPHGRFTEETAYAPRSPYSATKAASDHMVKAWHHTYGLPALTTNCSNNYGPYQFPEKLIPLVIRNALARKPLPVYGSGKNVRDWLFVDDHVRALRVVADGGIPGETYNVGGNNEYQNLDVVRRICALVDAMDPQGVPRESLITFVEDRPGHDARYAIDATKIKRDLGWQPIETFETGLRRTVQWYFDNATWVERVLSGAYEGGRLGLGAGE